MLRRLTAKQLRDWEIYAELEPFDELRQDLRIALVCAVIANSQGKKQDGSAYQVEDFLLKFGPQDPKPKQHWKQQFEVAKIMAMQAAALAKQGGEKA